MKIKAKKKHPLTRFTLHTHSLEDGLDYNKVKATILQAYELVSEAYRQRFRGPVGHISSILILQEKRKRSLIDGVQPLKRVHELMLLEEFKNCLPEQTAVYLNEQKVYSKLPNLLMNLH